MRSSSDRFASQERFGCVLSSILGPSGPQNLCSRRGESIDFRKAAFPLSIFIFASKTPLKMTSWTPQWHSRRIPSASRALPDAVRDAFRSSLRSLGALLGAFGPFWSAQDPVRGTPAPLGQAFWRNFVRIWGSTRQKKKAFITSSGKKMT